MAITFTYDNEVYTVPNDSALSENGQIKVQIGSHYNPDSSRLKIAVQFIHNNPRYPGTYYCPEGGDGVGYGTGGPNDGNSHAVRFRWTLTQNNAMYRQGTVNSINVSPNAPQTIILFNQVLSWESLKEVFRFNFKWDDSVIYKGYYGIYQGIYYWVDLNFNLNLSFDLSSATNSFYRLQYISNLDSPFRLKDWPENKINNKYPNDTNYKVLAAPVLEEGNNIVISFTHQDWKYEKTYLCKYEIPPVFLYWESDTSMDGKDLDGNKKSGKVWYPNEIITSNFLGGTISLKAIWLTSSTNLSPVVIDFSDATQRVLENFSDVSQYDGWLGSNGIIYPFEGKDKFSTNFTFVLTINEDEHSLIWVKTEDGWKKGFLWVKTSDSEWEKSRSVFVKTENSSWQSS